MKKSQLKVFFTFLLLAAAAPLFAQVPIGGMQTLADNVFAIFTSDFTKIILMCCLCGCAIAYGFNKDNEKMKRNVIAIAIAIGVLALSSQIVTWVYGAANG